MPENNAEKAVSFFDKFIKSIGQMVNSGRDIALVVIGVLVLSSMGLLGKFGCDSAKKNADLLTQISQGDLALGRATTELTDAKIKIDNLSKQVQKDIKDKNEQITKYAQLEAEYKTIKSQNGNATIVLGDTTTCGTQMSAGNIYIATDNKLIAVKSLQDTLIDNRLSITCGITPQANKDNKVPMSIAYNLDLKLRGELVETRTPDGIVNNYLNLYEIDKVTGKDVNKFELTKFTVSQKDLTAPHMMWWDPRLDLAISLGAQGISPAAGFSIGMSISGYGSTKEDLSWRFARLSLGLDNKDPAIGLVPALYNVARLFDSTLVRNIWLAPGVSYSIHGAFLLGVFVGVTL